jgi:hypothetical protein
MHLSDHCTSLPNYLSISHFTTDGESVLELRPSGTHDQILVLVRTVSILSWSVLPVERTGLSCNKLQCFAVLAYIYTYILSFFNKHF